MGQHDRFDPDATPPSVPAPPVPDETSPLHIQEATTPPVFPDAPTSELDPTAVLPVQPAVPVRTVDYPPVEPLLHGPRVIERRFLDERRPPAWPYVVAVLALLVGGLAGFLIGYASNDDEQAITPASATAPATPASVPADGSDVSATFDMLLARTQADGEYRTPSEYPQLDEITAIDTAAATEDLENQVAMLTVAQEEAAGLTDQVAQLEQALADMTAERDELATQLAESDDPDTDTQAQLDAANEQIETLEADLAVARTELDAANDSLTKAQADLDAANAKLDELNVIAAPNYVNGDVAKARSDAAANGWTLIEASTQSDAAAGTVLEQAPAPNSNMVEGSVLYVTVAENV